MPYLQQQDCLSVTQICVSGHTNRHTHINTHAQTHTLVLMYLHYSKFMKVVPQPTDLATGHICIEYKFVSY